MNSLKAIIIGIIFIIVASLLMQLAYVFVAVGYSNLAKNYPYLNEISGVFRYLVAIPIFIAIMFTGGYLTAVIANTKALLHCLVVSLITTGGMMWMALENSALTSSGIIIILLMIFGTVAGGLYWTKKNQKSEKPLAQ